MNALTPDLKRQMVGFRAEIDTYRKSAAERNISDPDLSSIPGDLLLLRTVVPDAESISDSRVDVSDAIIVLKETMIDDGKVYQSYQGAVTFEYNRSGNRWLLKDVIFNRQGTPFRLTEYYEKRSDYFRSRTRP